MKRAFFVILIGIVVAVSVGIHVATGSNGVSTTVASASSTLPKGDGLPAAPITDCSTPCGTNTCGNCCTDLNDCIDWDLGVSCCTDGGQTFSCPGSETVHRERCPCGPCGHGICQYAYSFGNFCN